ncbi:MAG: GTPase [Granulosicoccus sp.]
MSTANNTDVPAKWIEQLLHRYARALTGAGTLDPDLLQAFHTLQLADAVRAKLRLLQSNPLHCQQLAVVGPTQSGKSSLVNTLLDSDAAGISALAGFTVHAQGYATGVSDDDLQAMSLLMEPMLRTPAAMLDAQQLDTYVLEKVTKGKQALVDTAVVWDTPDFDSIESNNYKRAVLRTMGFADLLILIVSKDKYGDKSVWDILALLHTLQQPLVICINKVDQTDEQTILNAFKQRYQEQLDADIPTIVMLPFVRKADSNSRLIIPDIPLVQLADAIKSTNNTNDHTLIQKNLEAFINVHRSQWLAPLIDEQQAQSEWSEFVDTIIETAEDKYSEGYLNNPGKYDTFNRALAELLTLLEIPGIAPTLARTRQVVTWPARKLLGLGRTAIRKQFQGAQEAASLEQASDEEAAMLETILDSTLLKAQGKLLEQSREPFWNAMNEAFRERETEIRDHYLQQSQLARQEFEPRIDAAAQRLYEKLQSQPALLNTLRATRVTADAAGVALAIKSGGLAAADLLLAPAMFSVTTLLTESALGTYLDSIKKELKEQQGQHINSRVLRGVLGEQLHLIAKTLDNEGLLTQKIEPELEQVLSEQH